MASGESIRFRSLNGRSRIAHRAPLVIGRGHVESGKGDADWLTVFPADLAMALKPASADALADGRV